MKRTKSSQNGGENGRTESLTAHGLLEKKDGSGVPIDRGWAWMIVLGCFINLFVLLSLARSLGIFFVILKDHYGKSATSTATLFMLLSSLGLWTAPITTALADMFTCRSVCTLGGILVVIGLIVASFGNSLEGVIYPYGIIAGVGGGLLLNPGPVIISRYFDERRALANGLVFAGSGLGAIVGPYMVHVVLSHYGIHQALFLFGGFALNTLVACALFRPISFWKKGKDKALSKELTSTTQLSIPETAHLQPIVEGRILEQSYEVVEVDSEEEEEFSDANSTHHSSETLFFSAWNLQGLSVQDIPGTLCHQSHFPGSHDIIKTKKSWWRRICYISDEEGNMSPLIDVTILKNPAYLLYAVGSLLGMTGFYLSLLTPAYAKENLGLDQENAAILLSIMGGSDLTGRLFVGFVSDISWLKPYRGYSMAFYLLIASLTSAIIMSIETYEAQVVYLLTTPFCIGGFIALGPVILGDLVGVKNMSSAWGILLVFEGIGHFITPLTIGTLKDHTGSYRYGYYFVSVSLLMSSICIACASAQGRRQKSQ